MTVAGEARLSAGIIEDFHCLHSPVIGCQDYTHLSFYHNHKYIRMKYKQRQASSIMEPGPISKAQSFL